MQGMRWLRGWRLGCFLGMLGVALLYGGPARVEGGPAAQEAPPDTQGAEPVAPDATPTTPTTIADADEFWLHGEYERALEAYGALSADAKSGVRARIGAARCKMDVGRYEDALRELVELNAKDSAEAELALAQVCVRLGRYDEVLAHARKAIELDMDQAAARLVLAQTLELLSRRDEAIEVLAWFDRQLVERKKLPRDAAWVTAAAQGFLRYSVLTQKNVVQRTQHALNDMLQHAYQQLDRNWWPARIAAADLLREKYNNDEQDGSLSDYAAALKINEKLPEAHVGMGWIALDNWAFEEVEKHAERALKTNPQFAPAFHLLGRKWVVERRYQNAIESCERALAINPHDLIAMSISAAASACRFDQRAVDQWQQRVASISPRFATFHRTVGDALGGIRQYAASESAYLKAIEYDATDANARTELGMMYMQWGLEDKATAALDAAWALDKYNQRTKFTLELLDSIKKFATHETTNFIVRYNPETEPGLGEYLAGYLEEIYKPVTEDFDAPLHEKTIIEVFPSHAAFSVRITGRPWIPTVGACSGRVIALTSPRDSVDTFGPFNFARVLKHEFTHTVTLAATQNRIPHWFTEGLAVYQEDAPRGFDWAELLAAAVRRNELFTIESIDWGFMRPRRSTDRMMAYAQSEWMCEYIVQRFGYDVVNRMLKRYHRGETQEQVFREELHIDLGSFDADFRKWAGQQAAQWGFDITPEDPVETLREAAKADGANAAAFGRLARAELLQGEDDAALTAARRAIELDAENVDALEVIGRIAASVARKERHEAGRRKYEDEAEENLIKLLNLAPKNWTALKLLGELALRRDQWDRAIEMFTRLQQLCPADPASWSGLAGVYLERGEDERALPQLLELARIELHDADVATKIAKIYRRQGKLRDAVHWFRQALFVAPLDAQLHELLGDVSMQAGDTATALREYRMLTMLEPKKASHFHRAATAAHKLGETETATKLAKTAVELDPQSPARALLP